MEWYQETKPGVLGFPFVRVQSYPGLFRCLPLSSWLPPSLLPSSLPISTRSGALVDTDSCPMPQDNFLSLPRFLVYSLHCHAETPMALTSVSAILSMCPAGPGPLPSTAEPDDTDKNPAGKFRRVALSPLLGNAIYLYDDCSACWGRHHFIFSTASLGTMETLGCPQRSPFFFLPSLFCPLGGQQTLLRGPVCHGGFNQPHWPCHFGTLCLLWEMSLLTVVAPI